MTVILDVRRRKRDESEVEIPRTGAKSAKRGARAATGVLTEGIDELVNIYYRPKTQETRQTYQVLLSFIQEALGDQPRDILSGAADEVLSTLKNEKLRDKERRKDVQNLLGPLADERYALLVNLGRKISDWVDPEKAHERKTLQEEESRPDENFGVNVQFEESDDEDEQKMNAEKEGRDNLNTYGEIDEDMEEEGEEADVETVLKRSTHAPIVDELAMRTRGKEAKEALHPRDVDAHWLQREIGHYIKEPTVAQSKALEVLGILKVLVLYLLPTAPFCPSISYRF